MFKLNQKLLLSLLCGTSLIMAESEYMAESKPIIEVTMIDVIMIASEVVVSQDNISNVKIFHDNKNFYALFGRKITKIEDYNIAKELRGITQEDVEKLLHQGGYLKLNQSSDGSFSLDFNYRFNGGGAGGATTGFWAGKWGFTFVAHGTLLVVAACTGPAAPATYTSLLATFTGPIEAASNAVAIGTAIALGVATGPV